MMPKRGTPPGKPRQFATREDVELMRSLYVDGKKTTTQIGDMLGFARSYVWTCLNRAGVKLRPNHPARKCADCSKPCGPYHRCAYHRKVRHAEVMREAKRKRDKIPRSRWRAAY